MKYDGSTRVLCPECNTKVNVGTAGPAGLAQHIGKGPCQDACQKREQERNTCTLFDFGVKKNKSDAGARSPPDAGSSLSKGQLAFPAPIIVQPLVRPASKSDRQKLDLQTPERKGCLLGWKLIGELRTLQKTWDRKYRLQELMTRYLDLEGRRLRLNV